MRKGTFYIRYGIEVLSWTKQVLLWSPAEADGPSPPHPTPHTQSLVVILKILIDYTKH